ncbi:MAG: NUDIX hydrolase [Epsilonproteobacteria bacterium]|nr:MAG: NUDIX hydrolase [Campylobacterota bacterium]
MIESFGITILNIYNNKAHILLCKSAKSRIKWGFVKGKTKKQEIPKQTAIREFKEETGIVIEYEKLVDIFFYTSESINIGIYLVHKADIKNIDRYFNIEKLKSKFTDTENSEVRFFDIDNLPPIKNKQIDIINQIRSAI